MAIFNGPAPPTPKLVYVLRQWKAHPVVHYFLENYIPNSITRSLLLEQKLYKGLPTKPGRWKARCTQGAGGTGGTAQPAPVQPAHAQGG